MGYKVFYDIESLSSGKFNAKLLEVIDECNDVLVILPPNSLERCVNEDDWLRLEVAYAIRQGKNIIPIMMKGFEWGKNIPEDIKELKEMIDSDIESVGGVEGFNNYYCANECITSWIDRVLDIVERMNEK